MQRQRRLVLALMAAGLMAYTSTASAQADSLTSTPPAADTGRKMFDPVGRLLERRTELKITDEQATRLEAIRGKYLEQHRGRMEELRRDRAARSARHASMDSTRAEVMAVLTPDQQKQVETMRAKWRSESKGGRHGRGHGHDDDD